MEGEHFWQVLSKEEHDRRWSLVEKRWGHWGIFIEMRPESGFDQPMDVLTFQERWFHYAVPLDKLHTILLDHGISLVWEFREDSFCSEIDLERLEPDYDGREGYWTSQDLDWLIYVSHESSLTVAGEWLIAAMKAVWPEWEQHLYVTYDYPSPP